VKNLPMPCASLTDEKGLSIVPLFMLLPQSSQRFLAALLGAVFPSLCVLCRETLPLDRKGLCLGCEPKVEKLSEPQCRLCGAEIPAFRSETRCADCRGNRRRFSKGTACFRYTRDLGRLIRKAKYAKRFELWDLLAKKAEPWEKHRFSKIDLISSIPMTKRERFKREISASEFLAKKLSRTLEIPCRKLLRKARPSAAQATLNRKARRENLEGAFQVRSGTRVTGKTVLLVDDVFTTGSTFQEASRALKKAGARRVEIAALARSGRYANS